ncbi:MAG: hypothetical protein LIQ30_09305 [Planctomycetes bacterium]|nr:hypothetical protein [Planctomycetota bacterium]MCD7896441.1 hypothetical protein [Planctomycetaceae bacterium]
MLRTLFLAAAGAFCGMVILTAALLGGCGGKAGSRAAPAPDSAVDPAATVKSESPPSPLAQPAPDRDSSALPEIGRDPSQLGRLETEAVVDASVFHAEHGASRPGAVRLAPGTWLLPAAAMPPPDDPPAAGGK